MANQTLTTTANYDEAAVTGLLNGETISVNGGNLTINSDVRWAQNAAVIGNLTISSTLGGSVTITGATVWEIAFDASSGNVPTTNAYGSNGVTGGTSGATGELLRVWATGSLTPSAAGGAMPASGWIKLRTKTGTFVDNETITLPGGATVTVNSSTGGKRSWIHVAGVEALTATVPRLGSFTVTGDWYELGTTNGADDQTFQFPVADACPAIWVETSSGSGIYEPWLNAGSRWGTATQYVSQDVRGKYFGMVNSTGVITIAQRASNACGYKPATGCKVRIPNVILSSTTSADYNANTINGTLATRYDFTTTSGGTINISYASMNWYPSFTSAFDVTFAHVGVLHAMALTTVAAEVDLTDVAFGLNSTTDTTPLAFTNMFSGINVTGLRMVKYASAAAVSVCTFTDCAEVVMDACQFEIFGNTTTVTRGNASIEALNLARVFGFEATDTVLIGGRARITSCNDVTFTGTQYADALISTTTTTNGLYVFLAESAAANTMIDGISIFGSLTNVHPYLGLLNTATGVNTIRMRNIGTAAAPFDGGSANAMAAIFNGTVTLNVYLQRIYTQNLRTGALTLTASVQNVVCDNVWGDGADLQAISALNITARGCRWTPTQTAQTAIYGHHWVDAFINTTQGRVTIAANEPLSATADQVSTSFGAGSGFTSTGTVVMANLADTITWTMPYAAIGYTALGGGLNAWVLGTNPANFDYDYQIDTGSGFSAWKQLVTARVRASGGTAGTNTFVITAVTGGSRDPAIGDYVGTALGTNFPANTTVSNIVGTTITLSANISVTLSASQVVFFWNQIEAEASFSAATGATLKVRATVTTANASNAISFISIPAETDSTSQQTQYSMAVGVTLTLTGLVSGSDIVILDAGTETERVNVDANSGTTYAYSFTTGGDVDICVYKAGYVPYTIRAYTLPATDGSLPIAQQIDRNYTP